LTPVKPGAVLFSCYESLLYNRTFWGDTSLAKELDITDVIFYVGPFFGAEKSPVKTGLKRVHTTQKWKEHWLLSGGNNNTSIG
jgi:hypothetical protein